MTPSSLPKVLEANFSEMRGMCVREATTMLCSSVLRARPLLDFELVSYMTGSNRQFSVLEFCLALFWIIQEDYVDFEWFPLYFSC